MDLWPEFLASSWGREFVAGGVGGTAGVLAGYPLDTLRIRQQNSCKCSAFAVLRRALAKEGPCSLYRGMAGPLASITFQNAFVFQAYATLTRAFDKNHPATDAPPPSYTAIVLGGTSTGALQSLLISPVELVKIRLQLQPRKTGHGGGTLDVARNILRSQGLRGIFRGLGITVLRDAPSHGIYFWTYEYTKEHLQPGCRGSRGQETLGTMLLAGGFAGVTSWISCYPLDVIKTRVQAEPNPRYSGIVGCFAASVAREGYNVLWRGLGTCIARAFLVNGVSFTAYEMALRCM